MPSSKVLVTYLITTQLFSNEGKQKETSLPSKPSGFIYQIYGHKAHVFTLVFLMEYNIWRQRRFIGELHKVIACKLICQ